MLPSIRCCGQILHLFSPPSGFLKSLGEPHLDKALAGHTDSIGGMIEAFDHPTREVDIHLGGSEVKSLLVGREALNRGEIQVIEDVGSRVGHGIELFRSQVTDWDSCLIFFHRVVFRWDGLVWR